MRKLHKIFTEAQIQNVRAPLDSATWLPNLAFTSQEFFALEVNNLFSRTWISVGFIADVLHPGDAMPLTILGGIPIVMVRDEDGTLRVFHNVCPHDGCIAIWNKERSLSKILGQYHGWVWNLDGSLRDATLFDGSSRIQPLPDRDANLKEIRSAEWMETVFINLSGDAQPFEEYIAPVTDLYSDVDLSKLVAGVNKEGSQANINRFNFECNWKTTYENFAINIYHEGFVHDEYKAAPNVPRVTPDGKRNYQEHDDRGYHGLMFSEAEADLAYGLARTPKLLRKDGAPHEKCTIMTLYPNTNISLFPNFLLITVLTPHSPDRTGYDSMILYPKEVASDPLYANDREDILDNDWVFASKEDAVVCKKVQEGRHSTAFDQHFYAPFWESMSHSFCNRILDDLEKNE